MKADILRVLTKVENFYPLSVQINLTNKCVARCNMCYKYTWPQEEMDIHTLISLFAELSGMNVQNIVFSGGEPFLYKPFALACQYLVTNEIPYGIITSGLWGQSEGNKYIVENAKWIRFSIDSIEKEEYKKIRGVDGFEKALDNAIWANTLNSNVRVNVTLQQGSLNNEESMKDFFKVYGLNTKFYNAYGTDYRIHLKRQESKSKKCYITKFHCVIDPSGDIYPCCHLYNDNEVYSDDAKKYCYGNIKENTFNEIWDEFINSDYLNDMIVPKDFSICKNCDRYDAINSEIEKGEKEKLNIFL